MRSNGRGRRVCLCVCFRSGCGDDAGDALRRRWVAAIVAAMLALTASSVSAGSLVATIEAVQPKVVKIYGAGGVRNLEAYQSGILISPDGHILTALSYVLDADPITVVLADGRRLDASLLGADPRLEAAVLKIDATGLPCFDLTKAAMVAAGARVLAVSNLFGVATGNEPASVQKGTVSVVTRLEARRGAFETPYHGPVYVLDVTTNNPGAAGGALITTEGQLAGMLGKELRNSLNNTWLNYALPIDELRQAAADIQAGKAVARRDAEADAKPKRPLELASLGIVLVPDVLDRTPPFVDVVRPDSPAEKAGVRPDDLIVLVGDRLVQSCKALAAELERINYDDPVTLTVLRQQALVEVPLRSDGDAEPSMGEQP